MASTVLPTERVGEGFRGGEPITTLFRSTIHPPITDRGVSRSRRFMGPEREMSRENAVDPRTFRTVLGHVPTGVVVVTTVDEGEPVGMAIGAFLSISIDPPLVGFFLDNGSGSLPRIQANGHFCVNVLGAHEASFAKKFSRPADRFEGVDWLPGTSGCPALAGATAWIECAVDESLRIGDHTLVVGAVRMLCVNDREPDPAGLVFYRGGFFGIEGEQLVTEPEGKTS